MRTLIRLASALLLPFLLMNSCVIAVAPVSAHAGEETITRFEPESAESEPTQEEEAVDIISWWPWVISATVLGFIAVGFGNMSHHSDSGSGGGVIDVGW